MKRLLDGLWWAGMFLLCSAASLAYSQLPEGSMGRVGDPFENPVAMSAPNQEFFYTVQHETTPGFPGIHFFSLLSPTGSATITVDGDLDLAAALKGFDKKRVRLTLESPTVTLQKIERN